MIKNLKIVIVAGPNDEAYIRKNVNLITSLNRESVIIQLISQTMVL